MKFHSFMVFIIDNPMEPFALFILWSLLGISGPQYVLSISRDLEPRLESTLFDELSLEDTKPTDQASLLDSNWLSDNVDSIDSDPNILFSDIPYLDGTDSGSLFAKTDNACDVGTADDVQLFGKKRRDASTCKNTFTGQVGNQNEPDEGNGSDQSGESNQENLPLVFTPTDIFPKEFDVCPPTIFKDSNIPVCRVFLPGTYILIPGEQYVTLLDVAPLAPFILPKMCLDSLNVKLWCCHDIVYQPRPFYSLDSDELERISQEPMLEFQRIMNLKNYKFDANICWLQSLIQYGEPVGGTRRGFKS